MLRHRLIIVGLLMAQTIPVIAEQPATGTTPPRSAAQPVSQGALRGTPRQAFGNIEGRAVDGNNHPLPRRTIRLRDIRNGKVIDTKMTDDTGAFTFRGVDPGAYVVELVDDANKVLAASDMLAVDPGQAVATVVKLPTAVRTLGGLLGHHGATAAIVAGSAAAAGVLAVNVKDCVSPPCKN